MQGKAMCAQYTRYAFNLLIEVLDIVTVVGSENVTVQSWTKRPILPTAIQIEIMMHLYGMQHIILFHQIHSLDKSSSTLDDGLPQPPPLLDIP